jgi:predicted ATPase
LGSDRWMLKTTSGRGYRMVGDWGSQHEIAATMAVAPARTQVRSVQTNMPAVGTALIGRNAAVQHLRDLLSAYRVVTLTGAGGIGKTRLALEVARVLQPEFGGDVWLIELASLSDANLVTTAVANALGLHLAANEMSPEALARALGGRRLLLVMDNCEHLIDGSAKVVETVIRVCPAVYMLTTSREALRIEGESPYRVPPLDFPAHDARGTSEDVILNASAVQLFIARMTGWQSDLRHPAVLAAIAAICRRLDGIPLAIEFAAARAATLGLEGVLSRLDDRFALLTTGRRTALPKHQTLRATLDWSYDLLSASERIQLRRLAIFAAAFSLEAAIAVIADGEVTGTEVAEGVANLVEKSLVAADYAGVVANFRLLETTRAYAFDRLAEAGELQLLARRHAGYYRRLLERNSDEREVKPTQLADVDNARAALEWCFGANGDAAIGVGLAAATAAPVFLAMSLFTECRRWSERALLALDHSTRGGREELHLQAARGMSLMYIRGQDEAAREALQRSLVIAEERGDAINESRLLCPLYLFDLRVGQLTTALRYVRRMSAVSEAIADPAALAIARALVGLALHLMGDLDGAQLELEAALPHVTGSRRAFTTHFGFDGHSLAGVTLARNLWLRGYPTEAVEHLRQAIMYAASLEHPVALFAVLIWGFSVFHWSGDLHEADKHVDFFISRAESYSLGPYLAVGRGFKAQLAIMRGEAEDAVENLRSCLVELGVAQYGLQTTSFRISLAQGLAAIGLFGEGIAQIDETIRMVEANGEFSYMAEALRVKGNVILSMTQASPGDAETCFMQSLEWSRRQGARAWELRTAVDLAALLVKRGRSGEATALLRPVFAGFEEGWDTADLMAAKRLLAALV